MRRSRVEIPRGSNRSEESQGASFVCSSSVRPAEPAAHDAKLVKAEAETADTDTTTAEEKTVSN